MCLSIPTLNAPHRATVQSNIISSNCWKQSILLAAASMDNYHNNYHFSYLMILCIYVHSSRLQTSDIVAKILIYSWKSSLYFDE